VEGNDRLLAAKQVHKKIRDMFQAQLRRSSLQVDVDGGNSTSGQDEEPFTKKEALARI